MSEEAALTALKAASHLRRALPNSPLGYTPSRVDCPSNAPSVRSAATLSQDETEWLQRRRNNTVAPMRDLLTRVNIPNFDTGSYIDSVASNASALPNIGIAMSGGGWRALMNGAGAIKAFDSRTPNNTGDGKLGGLLQSATYLAGLSGGGWLVGSIFVNNYTTIEALQTDDSGNVWEFGNSVVEGPAQGGIQVLSTAEYFSSIYDDVDGKRNAGFDISLTDVWGRGLSFQLINASDGAAAYTWSSIALEQNFQNADTPFPILVADARAPGELLIPGNTTVYEFNAFEMGTWDPTAFGFIPMQHLGTNFTAGSVPNGEMCVAGFDNAGFIMGTSSSLFNQFLLNLNGTDVSDTLKGLLSTLLSSIGEANNDIADYTPNPFYRYNEDTNPSANSERLTLVDGGEDLQNIPLHPLIQPARNVDVIFAVDSSADTNYFWPNATALVATYQRAQADLSNGTGFPSIPDQNTFVNLGLNTHPTFFGCDTANMTDGGNVPIIVYIPNYPYVAFSNFSTFQLETNNTQRDAVIANGMDVATMGNATRESTWPVCVACAILSRSMERTGTDFPEACTQCFDRFCWNGTIDSSTPPPYEPTPLYGAIDITSGATSSMISRSSSGLAIAIAAVAAFASIL